MILVSFKGHRFPPTNSRNSICIYARFTISLCDVELMLADRGLDVSYETIRRWLAKFGLVIAANLRGRQPTPGNHRCLDETVVVIRGGQFWLWRAADN